MRLLTSIFFVFVVNKYNTSEELLAPLLAGDIKYALLEENEVQFHLYRNIQSLAVYDFYKNSYDIGFRLFGDLKPMSFCVENEILNNQDYITKAFEEVREVCFSVLIRETKLYTYCHHVC